MSTETEEFWSVRTVARMLDVSVRQVYRLVDAKVLSPPVALMEGGTSKRFVKSIAGPELIAIRERGLLEARGLKVPTVDDVAAELAKPEARRPRRLYRRR